VVPSGGGASSASPFFQVSKATSSRVRFCEQARAGSGNRERWKGQQLLASTGAADGPPGAPRRDTAAA
jgi:hypothetical protein